MSLLPQFENPIQDFMEVIMETYSYLEAIVNLSAEGKHFFYLCPDLKYLHGAQFGNF
jgi:hypothetical protein